MKLSTMLSTKKMLRPQMKTLLKSLTEVSKADQSSVICNRVMETSLYQKSERVAIYISMNDEVQTQLLITDLLESGRKCFIPKYSMDSRHMDMIRLSSQAELSSLPLTKWNIQQPGDDNKERENALETGGLDLIIVPGLAFSLCGKRMGRGKGYYDTYLSKHEKNLGTRPKTLGLAFSEQVLDDVPTDDHDYVLDSVITDTP